jgi:hypothetical protein
MTNLREIKAAGLGALVVAIYMALVLMSGRVDLGTFSRLLSFYIGIALTLWIFLGGVTVLGQLVINSRKSGKEPFLAAFATNLVRDRWQRDRCVSLVWPPLLFATLLASFNAFKQMILPLAGFGWDPILAEADRALFFGTDPWRITHAVLGSPPATLLIDRAYHGWFVPMSLGLIACAWMPGSTFRLRTQYMLSYIAVWIGIGSILAFLMPSAGPCFYEHYVGGNTGFHELLQRMTATEAATGERLTSLGNQAMLMKMHGTDTLIIGGGISAMPSVHNALAALFALAAFQLNRTAGWLVAIYAAAIWIGSIHLGWHYALDGVVGVAMTLGIWIVCGRIAAMLDGESRTTGVAAAFA